MDFEPIMTYISIHTKSEKLRHAARQIACAKEMLTVDFGPAEEMLEMVNEDLDNAARKVAAALGVFDALMDEYEGEEV